MWFLNHILTCKPKPAPRERWLVLNLLNHEDLLLRLLLHHPLWLQAPLDLGPGPQLQHNRHSPTLLTRRSPPARPARPVRTSCHLSPVAPLIDSATFPDVNPESELNLLVVLHSGLTPPIELDSFDTPVSHCYSTVILC
jgi:hypothetical protein